MYYDENMDWFVDNCSIQGNDVEILYLTKNENKALKCKETINTIEQLIPQIREEMNKFCKTLASEWEVTDEELEKLKDAPIDAISFYSPTKYEVYFTDKGIFGDHSFVAYVQNGKIEMNLEG